jgi:hypothetical protein
MSNIDPKDAIVLGGLVVGLFLLYKGVNAAGKAAAAVGGAVADTAKAAESATVATVGAIGAAVGLPTPSETISDPRQVRWIMDHVGSWPASQWGTASAYISALNMAPGSGDNSPPPAYVLARLGVAAESVVTQKQVAATVDFVTGGAAIGGGWGLDAGPSFSDVASGNTPSPFFWSP